MGTDEPFGSIIMPLHFQVPAAVLASAAISGAGIGFTIAGGIGLLGIGATTAAGGLSLDIALRSATGSTLLFFLSSAYAFAATVRTKAEVINVVNFIALSKSCAHNVTTCGLRQIPCKTMKPDALKGVWLVWHGFVQRW
jgi:hypothetical protein